MIINTKNICLKSKLSIHHKYGIDKLGKDLIPISISPKDNSIEAIQHKDYKIFGQMWHPERENPFNANNCKIISFFFHD